MSERDRNPNATDDIFHPFHQIKDKSDSKVIEKSLTQSATLAKLPSFTSLDTFLVSYDGDMTAVMLHRPLHGAAYRLPFDGAL